MDAKLMQEGWEKESVVKEGGVEITIWKKSWLRDRKIEELRKVIRKEHVYTYDEVVNL